MFDSWLFARPLAYTEAPIGCADNTLGVGDTGCPNPYAKTWSYYISQAIPAIHERTAHYVILMQWVGK